MRATQGTSIARGATPAQIREAERGFKLWLRRRFSAVWIAEHASDLLGQANVEYAEWLEDHPPARNPVGWLLVCAERRAKNLLDTQTRRPPSTPLDALFHLADESTPTPEQQALDHDRQERLRRALGFLAEKERKLLALVYFEDHSIREAGRKLGWQKSAADRHHNWALEKLRALVGDDRSLLSPASLGLVAWLVVYGERRTWRGAVDTALTPARQGVALALEAAEWIGGRLGELGRKLLPATDHASAAATSGGGRLLGACGVAAASVVCGLAASGLVSTGGEAGAVAPAVPAAAPPPAAPLKQESTPMVELPTVDLPVPDRTPSTSVEPKPTRRAATPEREKSQAVTKSRQASTKQTVNEFGVERGSVQPEPAPEPAPEPQSPPSGSSGESSSGGSGAGSPATPAKAGNTSEFAM